MKFLLSHYSLPSLLYSCYWASFPRVKWPGRDNDKPNPNGAVVKN